MVQAYREARYWMTGEACAWEVLPAVGREFGSPDYDRLVKIDALAEGAIIEYFTETGFFVGQIPGIVEAHVYGATREEVAFGIRDVLEMISTGNRGRRINAKNVVLDVGRTRVNKIFSGAENVTGRESNSKANSKLAH